MDDRSRLNASKGLADDLEAAALARDEARFTALTEAVLHEPDEAAVGMLAPFLGVGGGIGRVAAHGLLMLGATSLDALVFALAGPDAAARQNAAWALGSLGDPRTVDALLAAAEDLDSPPGLVEAALASLAELADRRAVPRLRRMLGSGEWAPHWPSLCRALGHIGDTQALADVARHIRSPDAQLQLRAAEALVRLLDREKRGWPVIFGILRGDDARGDSMVTALRDLGDLSSSLATFLGDDQYHLRREAAELLGTFGDPIAVPPLIEALRDINPWVRGAAAYSLGRVGDRKALAPLQKATRDASDWVRLCAVRALGLAGDRSVRRTLDPLLFDPDPDISSAAQEAIDAIQERG